MDSLIQCPFCGSGWLYEIRRNGYCDETPAMFCNSCKAVVTWEQVEEEGANDETKTFVREHWNTRAETAKLYSGGFYLNGRKFIPERTCEMNRVKMFPEYEDCVFECLECSACKRTNDEQRPRYCPNCGAKVVDNG